MTHGRALRARAGEVAEVEVRDQTIVPLKPGPKPKPKTQQEMVAKAVKEYQEQQAIKNAKSKIPKGHKKPTIAKYKSKPRAKAKKGLGKKGMKG